jgi:hypothetical protein
MQISTYMRRYYYKMTTKTINADKPYSGWKARTYGYLAATLLAVAIETYTPLVNYINSFYEPGQKASHGQVQSNDALEQHLSQARSVSENTGGYLDNLSAAEYALMRKGPAGKKKWLTSIEALSWSKPIGLEYLVDGSVHDVLQKVDPVGAQYFDLIMQTVEKYSNIHTLDPLLLWSVAYRESRFDKNAESDRGARGLFQITKILAKQYGVRYDKLFDPAVNIDVAVHNLAELAKEYGGYMPLVFAVHNTGLNKLTKKGLSYETQIFITETLTFNEYVRQCLMHPELVLKKKIQPPSQA